MSDRIDQRIVEMSFENHKFEKGIKQSKGSLKEFANALEKSGTGRGFEGLEKSVNSVTSSFSVMEQIGIGALRKIGEAAITAGGNLIKSLSIDQLNAGLDKYQQKIESVQTMVSAGYNLDAVEKTMDQLMWFADETSYSFADMTDNMAKFVSAGIDLETSSKAMQGIATWAAHSGKNSQAASIAMFNLSQAIGMGYVDTLNWRSIMNQNMNTVMFKEIAIGVAEATGAIEKGQVTIQNFDTNLKDKWFTNDVLLKTLDQYGAYAEKVKEVQEEMNFDTAKQAMDYMDAHAEKYGDVMNSIGNAAFKASQESKSFMDSINATMDAVSTGWMQTYEIIFGTLYEAKENFSALTEVLWTIFAASAETRNEMLRLIKAGGGIKDIFQIIKNVAVALLTPLRAVSAAFDQFFPPKTADQWLSMISIMESFTRGLIITEETAEKIQRTFAGFFAVVDIGWQTLKFLGSVLWEVVGIFLPLGGSILDTTASLGDFLVNLNAIIKQSGIFEYGLLGIKVAAIVLKSLLQDIIGVVGNFVYSLWTAEDPLTFIGETANKVFHGLLDILQTVTSWIYGKFTGAMKTLSDLLTNKFDMESEGTIGSILNIVKEFIAFLAGEAVDGLKSFSDVLNNLDFNRVATFVTGGVLLLFVNQLTNLTKTANSLVATTNTFVSKLSKKLFGTTTKIKDLAYVFGILSASLFVLSRIPWNELIRGFVGLSGALIIFVGAYAAVQAITVAGAKAMGGATSVKSTFGLVPLAAGLAIMALAISKISKIDSSEVWSAVKVMQSMMGLLVAYQAMSAVISKLVGTQAMAVKFSGMTFGIMGLVGIVLLLKVIKPDDLREGLGKLASIVSVIVGIQLLFGVVARISGGNKLSTNILGISAGLLTLIALLKILSWINIDDLKSQIANVLMLGGVIAAIQAMFGLVGKITGGAKAKTNILSIQVGMLTMIGLIAILGTMDPAKIQNGIKSIAQMALIIAGLEILTSLAARIGGGAKLQRILGAVTLTMLAFTVLIGLLSIFDQSTIDRGLLTITKMMLIIVAFETMSALAGRIGGTSGLGTLIGMVAMLLTVTASLSLLSMIDQEALRQASISFNLAVIAIGAMSVGSGILVKALSLLSGNFSGIMGMVKVLVPGFIAVGTLVLGAAVLFKIIEPVLPLIEGNWDGLKAFGVTVGLLAGLIAGFTALAMLPGLQNIASIASLIPGFAVVGGVILATAALFVAASLVPEIDTAHFIQFIAGLTLLSALLAGFTLLGGPLAALGPLIGPALTGALAAIAGVGMIIAAFVILATAMEFLFGKNPDFLINGIEKLIVIGEGIGRFFGSIIGGFNAEILASYGKGLAGFADAISHIDASSFEGIEGLSRAILVLTGAALLDGITRFLSLGKNPMDVFGKQLQGLINAFADITAESAAHTSEVLDALAPMAESLERVAKAAKTIPNSGGFLGAFLGDNKIDKFAADLIGFINGLGTINPSDVLIVGETLSTMVETQILSNLEKVANVAKKIPNSGGFLGAFLGDNKIDKFAEDLVEFINSIKGINVTDVRSVNSILESMSVGMLPALEGFSALANSLGASGGLKQFVTGNTTLSEFGKELAKFVKSLDDVDFTVIKPALTSLSQITDSFSVVGKDVMENAAKSFKNNKEPFQKEIINILDTASKTIATKKKIMVSDISNIFDEAIKDSKKYIKDFKKLGSDIVAGLRSGIQSESRSASNAIKDVASQVINSAKNTFVTASPSKVFAEIGGWLSKGLAVGITNDTKVATNASIKMASAVEESVRDSLGVHSISQKFKEIGEWLDKSIGSGIQNGKQSLLDTAADMGLDTSKFTINGIKTGIENSEGAVTTGISNLLELLTGPGSPVTETADGVGGGIGDGITSSMQQALSDSKKGIGGSETKQVIKTELEKLQSVLEEGKYYGQISLEEELAAYEALKLIKGQSAEDHKKIDREIYRLVKEIYEGQLSYINEVTKAENESNKKRKELYEDYLKNRTSAIEESEKKLSELSKKYDKDRKDAQESAHKKKVEADKKYNEEYNSILENAEKERQKLREDYASKQKSINDKLLADIDAQNKAYEDAVKSRADAIYNSYSLFAAVADDVEVAGEELLENLRGQIYALGEWQQSIEDLAARGVGDSLIEELQKLGPSSKAQIKALLELTDEQLTEYAELFEGKYNFARAKAEGELEDLKQTTSDTIKDLNDQAAIDLEELGNTFENSMANVNTKMQEGLTELKNAHLETMSEINTELADKLTELQNTFDEKTSEINKDTTEKLSTLKKEYNTSLDSINKEASKKLEELKTAYTSTMKTIKDKTTDEMKALIDENKVKLDLLNTNTKALLGNVEETYKESGRSINSDMHTSMDKLDRQTSDDLNTLNRTVVNRLDATVKEFEDAGYDAAKGFADGINRGSYLAISAVEYMASSVIQTTRKILDERSPSRIFANIGQFASLGFANGISNYSDKAIDAAGSMAENTIAIVSGTLSNLMDDTDLDIWEPVIAPVLDLSNISSNNLEGVLGHNVDLAFRSARLAEDLIQNGSSKEVSGATIINNFDLTGMTVRKESDIDQIATKLYQRQQSAQRGRGLRATPTSR